MHTSTKSFTYSQTLPYLSTHSTHSNIQSLSLYAQAPPTTPHLSTHSVVPTISMLILPAPCPPKLSPIVGPYGLARLCVPALPAAIAVHRVLAHNLPLGTQLQAQHLWLLQPPCAKSHPQVLVNQRRHCHHNSCQLSPTHHALLVLVMVVIVALNPTPSTHIVLTPHSPCTLCLHPPHRPVCLNPRPPRKKERKKERTTLTNERVLRRGPAKRARACHHSSTEGPNKHHKHTAHPTHNAMSASVHALHAQRRITVNPCMHNCAHGMPGTDMAQHAMTMRATETNTQ
jgi:hypothetical protein